jgi:hypothetical protein
MTVPTPTTREGVQVLEGEIARYTWAGRASWAITVVVGLIAFAALSQGNGLGGFLLVLALVAAIRSALYGRSRRSAQLTVDMARAEHPDLR